jgi:hypothetical protein
MNSVQSSTIYHQQSQDGLVPSPLQAFDPLSLNATAIYRHASSSVSPTSLLFVDPGVTDYQHLASNVAAGTEVYILNPVEDAIAQITQFLVGRTNISSLHLVSHGAEGSLQFSSGSLDSANLHHYFHQIQSWSKALTVDADILLYGCDIAQDTDGQTFIRHLGQLTQADIAASTNRTGNAALAGDWNLEFTTGFIESSLALGAEARSVYSSVLAVLVDETFTNSTVNDLNWLFGTSTPGSADPILTAGVGAAATGGIPGRATAIDAPGQGVLRLTNPINNQGSFVIYNEAFPASGGLSITFEIYQYGGTGADGISFFLIDGNANPTTAGQLGGGLGYSGIVGGYFGVGLDAFGNFSNPAVAGAGGPGQVPDSVVLRGSEATGYRYFTGQPLGAVGNLDVPVSLGGTRANSRRRVRVDVTPVGIVDVLIDLNDDNDFNDNGEQPIVDFNVTAPTANNAPLPATFKFGFAGSTGTFTNFHEVRALAINSLLPIAEFTTTALTVNENVGTVSVPIVVSEPYPTEVILPYRVVGSTATDGSDYTLASGSITIPAGSLGGIFPILNVIDDNLVEGAETVTVLLEPIASSGVGIANTFTLTIADNDAVAPPPFPPQPRPNQNSDFNRDGFADLVWRDYETGRNVIWLMNRTNLEIGVELVPVAGSNWVIEGTGDLNADGSSDIIWRDYNSGRNLVWFMEGTTSTVAVELPSVTILDWDIEGIDDFNGDGNADLLWRNYRTSQSLIWLMSSTAPVSTVELPAVFGSKWDVEATGDFDGDSQTDIVWRNYRSGRNVVWLMNGTTLRTGVELLPEPNTDWFIEGASDYNLDGEVDLIWRNYSTDDNRFWLFSNTKRIDVVDLIGVAGNDWHIEDVRSTEANT